MNIIFSYMFLSFWLFPQIENIELIYNFIILLMFECIMIHTRLFMSIVGRSWSDWLYGLVFFGLFAVGFNSIVSGYQILIIYGALVLNRMLSGLLNRGKIDKRQEEIMSIVYFTVYLILIVLVAIVSAFIPEFGLTEDFLEVANYESVKRLDAKFELIDMPHVTMCFGVLYYIALTFIDIFSILHKVKSPTTTSEIYR